MLISFVEIQNFRRLKSIHIDFADKTTLLVGANNSGKTSAIEALIHFLKDQPFTTKEFTLSDWRHINKIGEGWERNAGKEGTPPPELSEWENFLPLLDVWLQVEQNEIRYVNHLLPSLEWKGGLLGVRLRFEPKKIEELYKNYLSAIQSVRDVKKKATKEGEKEKELSLWPNTMQELQKAGTRPQRWLEALESDRISFICGRRSLQIMETRPFPAKVI